MMDVLHNAVRREPSDDEAEVHAGVYKLVRIEQVFLKVDG